MGNEGQKVKDIAAITRIIESSFFSLPVYMFFQNKNYPIKPVTLTPDGLIIKSIGRQDRGSRLLVITNGGNLFRFEFEFKGTNGNYEILFPKELHIIKATRDSGRTIIEGNNYLTNFVNQSEIPKSINYDQSKIIALTKSYLDKLKDKIDHFEIVINERMDNKMRILNNFDKPIFIPHKLEPEQVPENCVPYKEYSLILKTSKTMKNFSSETTFALKYKNLVPFGYISAYNSKSMDINGFKLVEAISQSIYKDIINFNLISESKEKSAIADISQNGISFLHPNSKNFSKLFSIGAIIVFDLPISNNEKYTLRAIVRNIKPTETSFRVGCEFFRQTPGETEIVTSAIEVVSSGKEQKPL
ncbi:MAG: PilZ domain-containing protein [Leptospiraceae bacterium]|nr:PilZ domain-containing protein [Leptospiraceae bacterium]